MVVPVQKASRRSASGFTLVEVVVALVIMALLFAGIVFGYTQSSWRAEWSSYNLAAQNLALQGLEQARAAKWDPLAATPVDQCIPANFPSTSTNKLDVPISGTNITYATVTWTIKTTTGNYPLKMIQVDCTWPFQTPNGKKVFTNTVATFRAPNQ
jgi:prepilin-type N-terminal cleavage/methylation domain-containing protein